MNALFLLSCTNPLGSNPFAQFGFLNPLSPQQGPEKTLHAFSSLYPQGDTPNGDLILSGNTLYGTDSQGGVFGGGVLFSVGTDGSNYTILYNFTGNDDGNSPSGGLVLSGGILYGLTSLGGINDDGTIFSIRTDGSHFTTLYNFADNGDGSAPYGTLILSGSTLYGMTEYGGINENGTIFSISTSGSGFATLYSFTNGNDGANPLGNLIISGSTLYGMAEYGGANGNGTIFSISTSGSGFATLYSFIGGTDGENPVGSLILSGGVLYGMAEYGGANGKGTIFSINTSGSGFATLHTFTGGNDGAYPQGSLTLLGSVLYGVSSQGGSSGFGSLFSMHTDGSSFAALYSFTGTSGTATPDGSLLLSGSRFYGTTSGGGTNSGGAVFGINLDGSGFSALASFNISPEGANPSLGLVLSGNLLYGANTNYGAGGTGVVFSLDINSGQFTALHSFQQQGSDGFFPNGDLVLSGNVLYGMTSSGGSSGGGTVFSMNIDGSSFTTLHSFTGGADGCSPLGGLVISGNILYGTTASEGACGNGTVFSIHTDGSSFATLHTFAGGAAGYLPLSTLTLSNNVLYGSTYRGGTNNNGIIFSLATDGSGFTVVHTFTGTADGASPFAKMIASSGILYGTTNGGGANGGGTVFSMNTDGSHFTTLHGFSGSDGNNPNGMVLSNGVLYGTTQAGGSNNAGTFFSVSASGSQFSTLYFFAGGANGTNPSTALTMSGNIFYGGTSDGGLAQNGTIFAFTPP
jgi:uncharacterized repeat protein (TIGR03803 family)